MVLLLPQIPHVWCDSEGLILCLHTENEASDHLGPVPASLDQYGESKGFREQHITVQGAGIAAAIICTVWCGNHCGCATRANK